MNIMEVNEFFYDINLHNNIKTTMRLDPSVKTSNNSYLHFITKEELRILVAIEIGMKNHQYVPLPLISSLGNLRSGQTYRTTRKLLKNKLIVHIGGKCDGYKLTYLGYDYLALHTFLKRGVLKDVICKIGVGKESDIYKCQTPDGTHVVLKLTRLGRRSFRTIKNNRQYLNGRNSYNWLYLSRLSSIRQFTFMQILHQDGFPTPKPIDTNRHAIVMSLIDGDPLCHIRRIGQNCSVKQIFQNTLDLAKKFAARGLIHGDFNQFNIMINSSGQLTVIDFPQCISTKHINAQDYFNRDIECLYTFFDKMLKKSNKQQEDGQVYIHEKDIKFDVASIPMPILSQIVVEKRLDQEVHGRGHFRLSEEKQLDQFMKQWNQIRNQEHKQGITQQQNEQSDEDEEQGYQNQQQLALHEEQIKEKGETEGQVAHKIQQQGDEDLKQLMNQLKDLKVDESKEGQQSEEDSDEDSGQQQQIREQWKGLTAYQIRQKIKQQKRIERQKKKQEMSTNQYIKKALHRKKKKQRELIPRGNYGAKKRAVEKAQKIKDGLQLGW